MLKPVPHTKSQQLLIAHTKSQQPLYGPSKIAKKHFQFKTFSTFIHLNKI